MHAPLLSVLLALVADGPVVQEEAPPPDDGEAYCRFAEGVAQSEAALLRAPEVFASVGHFSTVGTSLEPAAGVQTTRILAGLRYDLARLVRGNLLVRRARAECERYRAMARLEGVLRDGQGATLAPALATKIAILRNRLPNLMQRMDGLQNDVAAARATVEDLHSFRIRVDELRDAIAAAELQLAQGKGRPMGAEASLSELLDAYWEADREVERVEGELRRAHAFGLELKGGYEELLTVEQGVPLFGIVTLSYNLGHLWQGGPNRRAREARGEWRRVRGGAPGSQRIAEALHVLESTRVSQRKRLEEVRILAKDIAEQLEIVEGLETRKVSRFRDYLWLESTRLEAERAFLEKHVEELDRFLGPRPEAGGETGRESSVRGERGEGGTKPGSVPTIQIRR